MVAQGAEFWPLKLARELDDAILDIRLNELDVAAIVFKSSGEPGDVLAYDRFLDANQTPVGPRDPPSVEARAQARRPHLALAGDANRARLALPARSPNCRSPAIAPTC